MNDQILQEDISTAEGLDEIIQDHGDELKDVEGSLEAIGQAFVLEEPKRLTDHQQFMVDEFKNANHIQKHAVFAVADKAALEGFFDAASSAARSATKVFCNEIPVHFKLTAKALRHYSQLAQKLRLRLLEMRPLLAKREFPFRDVFDYGSHARFFIVNGKAIDRFSQFEAAIQVQNTAMRHVLVSASSYSVPVTEKLLKNMNLLQAKGEPETEQLTVIRDEIARMWEQTWKDAALTNKPGQTPQIAIQNFPERRFISLAPLPDNRYLVAYEPKSKGGNDYSKVLSSTKHYGVSLVAEKKATSDYAKSMNLPNCSDMLTMLDQVVTVLNDMQSLEDLAKECEGFAKEFRQAADTIGKRVDKERSPQFYSFLADYFKLATAVGHVVQEPYVQMAWAYIRSALVITSMVELSVYEETDKFIATNRFFTKQIDEYSNPALESYELTTKSLAALGRVKPT